MSSLQEKDPVQPITVSGKCRLLLRNLCHSKSSSALYQFCTFWFGDNEIQSFSLSFLLSGKKTPYPVCFRKCLKVFRSV